MAGRCVGFVRLSVAMMKSTNKQIVRDWRTSTWCPDVPTCQPTRLILDTLHKCYTFCFFPWKILEINGGKWSNSADFPRHVWRRILLLHFCFKRLSCFKKLCIQSALATEFNSLSHLKPFKNSKDWDDLWMIYGFFTHLSHSAKHWDVVLQSSFHGQIAGWSQRVGHAGPTWLKISQNVGNLFGQKPLRSPCT